VIEPLRISLDLACPAAHAFRVYTERASVWFPVEHTMTRVPGLAVVFEPRAGGRILERTADGMEADWGTITAWEPPGRLAYEWFIATDRAHATQVEIRFVALAPDRTRMEIEHSGWDRLGDGGETWREANLHGWGGVLPAFQTAAEASDVSPLA